MILPGSCPRVVVVAVAALLSVAVVLPAASTSFAQPKPQNAQQAREGEDHLDGLLRQFGEENSGLREKIDAAIRKGVDFMLTKQRPDGSFPCYDTSDYGYPMGGTAFCALAIKKSMTGLYEGDQKDLDKEVKSLEAKEKQNKITYAEVLRLKFLREQAPQEIALRIRMASAVDKALAWIKKKYAEIKGGPQGVMPGGKTGMNCKTYDIGIVLMLLEGYYTEKKETKDGYVFNVDTKKIPKADLDWVREMTDWMADRLVTVEMGNEKYKGGGWRYPGALPDASVDNSNTQYAVLGLKAASRLGVQVKDPKVWRDVAEYFIQIQDLDGPEVRRNPPQIKKETGKYAYADNPGEAVMDKARGWGYLPKRTDHYPTTGAMTTAALAALIMAKSGLYEAKVLPKDADLEKRIDRAINDGLCWMGKHFTVETNPGEKSGATHGWHYYYLYGMERAGVLCQVEHFAKHPWYVIGAKYLISKQAADGSWNSNSNPAAPGSTPDWATLTDTCFALLFLKRATTPVKVPLTVPKPVITGDK